MVLQKVVTTLRVSTSADVYSSNYTNVLVTAWEVTSPPMPYGLQLVVHREIRSSPVRGNSFSVDKTRWVVSEKTSGRWIIAGTDKEEAIARTVERLERVPKSRVMERILYARTLTNEDDTVVNLVTQTDIGDSHGKNKTNGDDA